MIVPIVTDDRQWSLLYWYGVKIFWCFTATVMLSYFKITFCRTVDNYNPHSAIWHG